MTIESGVRRIVVGVDGSAESVAALRWACREASLRAAEVIAVLAQESACHQVASYAVPAPRSTGGSWGAARDLLRRSVSEAATMFPGVSVRTEIAEGLAARVLLDQAGDADLLVLGRTAYGPDPYRAAGPVIRACLRASACPVVIIGSASKDSSSGPDQKAPDRKIPGRKTPDQKAPDQKAPDQKAPDQKAPDQKAPDQKAPERKARVRQSPADHLPEPWQRDLEGSGAAR
jgi:nucleotide-binding universal stress UspA family protein